MHITAIHKNQTLHQYASKGSIFHLSVGAVRIQEAPVYSEATALSMETQIMEGELYTVQKNGWIRIHAIQPSELLVQEPVSHPLRLIWAQCRLVFG